MAKLGPEAEKAFKRRGPDFVYTQGCGLDIGYRGGTDGDPYPNCKGIDLGDHGYDGVHLPFPDNSFDFIHSSHCLEHVKSADLNTVIQEWFRVVKMDGFIVCTVPHQYLYEKRVRPLSQYNGDHKRFYTPSSLLREFEEALEINSYRVRMLADRDAGFDYTIPPDRHSCGEYEIELIIQKIEKPAWSLTEKGFHE